MKTQSMILAALASAPAALAHTAFTNFYVDGIDQVRKGHDQHRTYELTPSRVMVLPCV